MCVDQRGTWPKDGLPRTAVFQMVMMASLLTRERPQWDPAGRSPRGDRGELDEEGARSFPHRPLGKCLALGAEI